MTLSSSDVSQLPLTTYRLPVSYQAYEQKRMHSLRLPIAVLIALGAHLCLWFDLPLIWQTLAVLVLAGFLPGVLFVEWLVGQSDAPPDPGEQLLYSIGAGYALMVVGMLCISYLPGGIAAWQTILVFDMITALFATLIWWHGRTNHQLPSTNYQPSRWLISALLLLLIIASFLRFTNLGYAEFHGDEARAILRAAGVIQGYEDVLFLHKKGPAEILLPALIFSLTGHMDETSARLPFALANLAGIFAVFLLGRRLLGGLAGWSTALLLTFDGYLIAFARFVQYQSLVFLTMALVVLILYRLLQQPKALRNYLILAAILLATGLLAHYEAATAGAPALFLFALLAWRLRDQGRVLMRALWPALLVGVVLLALFYLPFIEHPHFASTSSYLDARIDSNTTGFLHNNLADVFRRSIVYNSTYAVLFLVGLIVLALLTAYWRGWPRRSAMLFSAGLLLLLALTIWRTDWLTVDATDYLALPFALALILIWLAPRLRLEERLLWLWFGATLLLAIFFTATPRTHIYIFFTPWALLAGMLLAQSWQALRRWVGSPLALAVGGAAALLIGLVLGIYAYWYFVETKVEVLRTWATNRPAAYWSPYDAREVDSIYGFPLANGWKVIGVLYAQGVLQGDYETNQRYVWIPDWYTRNQHRCAATAQWYFAVDGLEPWAEDSAAIEDRILSQGFRPWGVVQVNDAPRLKIYRQGSEEGSDPSEVQVFQLNDYGAQFDAMARPDLKLGYPVIENHVEYPLHVNFNNQIWLEGYDITYNEPLQPGDTFRLTLYWRAQQLIDKDYKVFNQAYDSTNRKAAQKDGYSVCDREPTTTWSPGKLITDMYDIPVAADAPNGMYPLYTGLYLEETQARLPVLDATGNAIDNHVHITDIRVGSE